MVLSMHAQCYLLKSVNGEIRKCRFWCKPPLFDHFCGAPMPSMKIIYSFTNNLLTSGLYDLVFMKTPNWQSPIGYFIIPTIYYSIHNLLYGPNFSWSLMGFALRILKYKILSYYMTPNFSWSLILVIKSSLSAH